MKRLNLTLVALFFVTLSCTAQDAFRFKRKITGVEREGWHSITLPFDIFAHLNPDFSDIRLFRVNLSDSLEIPYSLDVRATAETSTIVTLPVLNQSYLDGALYLMFHLAGGQVVNYIDLDFAERNYFGHVTLQGSDNRMQWFDIIADQRIVSVNKSGGSDYKLSRIDFPRTDYRFLRARVQADVPLTFRSASFRHNEIKAGRLRDVPLMWDSRDEKKSNRTVVDIQLQDFAPVSLIDVKTDSGRDYYRPLRIEFVADSFKTDKGWVKSYETLYEGYLTSFRPNKFTFPWKLAGEMRMIISNFDDQPIGITSVSAAGPTINVVAKLAPGDNVMLYGNDGLRRPSYDLAYFQSSIPDSLASAQLGSAEALMVGRKSEGLIQSQLWLWTVMALMITGLGFFTIKMMKRS